MIMFPFCYSNYYWIASVFAFRKTMLAARTFCRLVKRLPEFNTKQPENCCPFWMKISSLFFYLIAKERLMRFLLTNKMEKEITAVTTIIPAIGTPSVTFNKPIPPVVNPAIPIRMVPTKADALPNFFWIGARANAIPLGEVNPRHNKIRNKNTIMVFLPYNPFNVPM